jgi:hypothetical protein
MRYQTQDISARTRFDTVLPEGARAEFFRPTRERIPIPSPAKTPNPWTPTMLMGGFLIFCLVILYNNRPQNHPSSAATTEVIAPVKEKLDVGPAPTPIPVPVVQATPVPLVATAPVPRITPVQRASLVRLPVPVPRAQLVRVPWVQLSEAHVDETHPLTMPYGTKIYATLRGFLASIDQLPRIGQPGDMYVVGTTPWIWTTVPGTFAPTWVDP